MICKYCYTDSGVYVAKRWEIVLPLEPPSQNTVAQNKGSFAARRKYKEYRDSYVILLGNAKVVHEIPDAIALRRVIVTRMYSGRGQSRDRSNIVGGCKPMLDAMHMVGLLVDDSEKWVRDFYHQTRASASGVSIVLEELG